MILYVLTHYIAENLHQNSVYYLAQEWLKTLDLRRSTEFIGPDCVSVTGLCLIQTRPRLKSSQGYDMSCQILRVVASPRLNLI
jgi:hypothetical protein